MSNKDSGSMLKHGLILALYYFCYVSIFIFLSPLLQAKGIALSTVGYLNAIGLMFLIISLVYGGILTDTYVSNKKMITINMALTLVGFLGFVFIENTWVLAVMYVMVWATFMSSAPILDGLVLKDMPPEKYAQVRSFGSIGAAISFFVKAFLLGEYSKTYYLLVIDIVLLVVLMIFLLKVKEHKYASSERKHYMASLQAIRKNKNLILILIITFCTYGVLAADDAYTINFHIDTVGISYKVFGLIGLSSILVEAVLMLSYNSLLRVISPKSILLMITLILAGIFFSKYVYYQNVYIINIGNVLLGVFVGLFVPVTIRMIDYYSDSSIKNTVLSIYQIAIKFGGALLGILTAIYYENTHFLPGIYLVHLLVILASLFFIFAIKSTPTKP